MLGPIVGPHSAYTLFVNCTANQVSVELPLEIVKPPYKKPSMEAISSVCPSGT